MEEEKNENSVWILQDIIRQQQKTIGIFGIPEGKAEGLRIFIHKIIAENFPSLEKDTDIQVQEAHRIPNRHYHRSLP